MDGTFLDKITKIEKDKDDTNVDCIEIEIPFNLFQYLNSESCNINNLCRICLCANSTEMFPLLTTKDDLPMMFTSFTSISVYPDEGLPTYICGPCKSQVITSYNFRIKCLNSDSTLKSLLKGDFLTKEPDVKTVQTDNENDQSLLLEIKKEEEEELVEDVQYLEDINDIISDTDNDTLSTIQNTGKRKKSETSLNMTDYKDDVKSENRKKSKSHVCGFCSKKFIKVKALRGHIKRMHSTTKHPHSCGQCKESFNSDHDLRLHSVLHSKGPVWKCNICNKEFKARPMLRRHIQRHMECKKYSCESCGKPFAELYALRRHARVHTGERVEKRHACHMCDKRYSESGLLTAHIARHTDSRPCVCDVCGKAFPSARLLASHRLVHSDVKPYPCNYCDKRFRHESTRNTHHRTHTGEKPYVCSVCGKTFIQNSNLTLHMRTHTGERPYTCETCGRKFTSGSSLKSHVRTHTGEKPYSCNVCGKSFARLDLRAHMRQHTGERPFACSVCPRKFVTASRLRDHCRIHTGEKPFECAICTLKFSTKSHLVKHVKTHDSNNISPQSVKKRTDRDVVLVRQLDYDRSNTYVYGDKFVVRRINKEESRDAQVKQEINECNKDIIIHSEHDMPLEVSGELVLQDDGEIKTDLLVVDDGQNANYQNETLCLSSGVNFVNNDMNYASDVNLVTVNEGEVSISASSAMLEGTTVKLYQLDQSLVQISSAGGQVTISKITSKMTANF